MQARAAAARSVAMDVDANAAPTTIDADRRRAILAAVIGNTLEWYDFAVYSFVATILAKNFFPAGDDVAALLATFAVFAVGFVVRPLGGIFVGYMGDAKGRKTALVVTILMMAIGTGMIGLIPTYATIGVLAPLLLVLARLLQSFSVGGEFASAVAFIVEWAPQNRRGLYGSFQQISTVGGLLLGSGCAALFNTILSPGEMESWGWRVLFLAGGVIGLVGLYMRRNIVETPAYREAAAATGTTGADRKTSLLLAARAFGFAALWTAAFFIFLFYMPTFTEKHAGLTRTAALWSNTAGLLLAVVTIPLMGALSDRIGRRPVLLVCCAAFLVLPYPLFSLMASSGSLATILPVQLLVGVVIALFCGVAPATMVEIFPTRSRSTYMSIGYALAATIFGGLAPFIATWLIKATGSPISPTFYVMGAAIISGLVILRMRETAHEPLR